MLMNLSSKKKGMQGNAVAFQGRTGHRAARINDSIFVVGGVDSSGRVISQVDRINCVSSTVDSVILESSISIEGFSLFCFEDSLFIWGGLHLRQHMNELLQFDGTKFIPLPQQPPIPKPRAYHAYALIAHKYLIVFAGSDHHSFFNDWNLLNLKTLHWQTLKPSLQISYNLASSMVWLNGRGILLVNEVFDETAKGIICNSFYEFYIKDYNNGDLVIRALQVGLGSTVFEEYVFNRMTVCDNNSILILGGYKASSGDLHNLSYMLHVDEMRLEKTKFKLKEKSQFQTIYHKNKLYVIGGIISKHQMEQTLDIYQTHTHHTHFKRNVCTTCKLYFDQEWFKTSKEAFLSSKMREEYDYNYHLRIDNRIIAKFSPSIPNQLYALTLLISNLQQLTSNHISISYHKYKDNYSSSIPEMLDHTYQTLKIGCTFAQLDPNLFLNEFIMLKQRQADFPYQKDLIEICILRLKLAIYRLGQSCLFTLRLGKEQVCIIYFSCMQLDCTYSNFNPFNNFHYYYNTRTKQCSSKTNRHIIHSNVKHIIKSATEYQCVEDNTVNIIIFCGDQIQNQIISFDHNMDPETGQTCSLPINPKEERKILPLIQLSFLPSNAQSNIFIQQSPLNFINIIQLLKADANMKILSRVQKYDNIKDKNIIDVIDLYQYPEEYWLHKILIYHSNRLIMHYKESSINICGVIVIKGEVQLDLSGNQLAKLEDQIIIKDIMKDLRSLRSLKRSHSFV